VFLAEWAMDEKEMQRPMGRIQRLYLDGVGGLGSRHGQDAQPFLKDLRSPEQVTQQG